jgi:hypothetical protein
MKRRAVVTEPSADPVFEDIPPAQMWMFSYRGKRVPLEIIEISGSASGVVFAIELNH